MILFKLLLAVACLILLYAIVVSLSAYLLVDPHKEYDTYSTYFHFLVQTVFWWIMVLWRVRITASGMEKVPEGQRFLLVGNHRSNFDPLVTGRAFKRHNLSFLSKERNLRIFVAGRLIRRICYMSIDRENARNAIHTIDRAADLMRRDVTSIAAYPEGTRSRTDEMLPFRNGVFKIAQKAGAPIVIACIRETEKIMQNYPMKRTRVHLEIIDVLDAEFVASHRTAEISDRVREILLKSLQDDPR